MPINELLPILLQIMIGLPQAIEGVQKIWEVATAQQPPTQDEMDQYNAALEQAHQALQRS